MVGVRIDLRHDCLAGPRVMAARGPTPGRNSLVTRHLVAWMMRTALTMASTTVAVALALRLAARLAPLPQGIYQLVAKVRLLVPLLAMLLVLRTNFDAVPSNQRAWTVGAQLTTIAAIFMAVWIVTRAVGVLEDATIGRFDISERDNLRARSIRTQIHLLRRVVTVVLVGIGAVAALLTFPWGRQLGTSILAAGGIIGVIIGVAGKPTIGNIVAGVEIALAGAIRIDDVVVVEGEWGHIEEITLTNVIVRLWDQRRLVLPTSYFVEHPFQNWTRRQAEIVGAVELWVDHSAPIEQMRDELHRLVNVSPHWDGRVVGLQVTDSSESALKVRAIVSAADASHGWDLRCDVREGLARWLVSRHPASLPRIRVGDRNGEATAHER